MEAPKKKKITAFAAAPASKKNAVTTSKSQKKSAPTKKKSAPVKGSSKAPVAKAPVVVKAQKDEYGVEITQQVLDLIELMKTIPAQRTPGWFAMRATRITASTASSVLRLSDIEIGLRDAGLMDMDKRKKVGQVMPSFNSFAKALRLKVGIEEREPGTVHMEHGVKYEDVIKAIYEKAHQITVHDFGLVPHPTLDWIGASPDGIRSDGIMVEIKCPYARDPKGPPKPQYWIQMQLQMFCCDLQFCDYLDCVIKEYVDRDDYLADKCYDEESGELIYANTAAKMPKGIMLAYLRYGADGETVVDKKYYPPAPVMTFESEEQESQWLNKWIEEVVWKDYPMTPERFANMLTYKEEFRLHYWYIEKWCECRVERHDEWLEKRIPELYEFWKLVEKCKVEGVPEQYLKKDKTTGKYIDTYPRDEPTPRQTRINASGGLSPPVEDNEDEAAAPCLFGDSDDE